MGLKMLCCVSNKRHPSLLHKGSCGLLNFCPSWKGRLVSYEAYAQKLMHPHREGWVSRLIPPYLTMLVGYYTMRLGWGKMGGGTFGGIKIHANNYLYIPQRQ